MIYDIHERWESSIMVKTALICRIHEQAAFTHEYSSQVHCLVAVVGCSVRLECIDANLFRLVQIPARLSPERLYVAIVAVGFSAEQSIPSLRRRVIKIYTGLRGRGRNSELVKVEGRKLLRNQVVVW